MNKMRRRGDESIGGGLRVVAVMLVVCGCMPFARLSFRESSWFGGGGGGGGNTSYCDEQLKKYIHVFDWYGVVPSRRWLVQ